MKLAEARLVHSSIHGWSSVPVGIWNEDQLSEGRDGSFGGRYIMLAND